MLQELHEHQPSSQAEDYRGVHCAFLTLFKSREWETVRRGTLVPLTLNNKTVVKTTETRGLHVAISTLSKTREVSMCNLATSEGYILYIWLWTRRIQHKTKTAQECTWTFCSFQCRRMRHYCQVEMLHDRRLWKISVSSLFVFLHRKAWW